MENKKMYYIVLLGDVKKYGYYVKSTEEAISKHTYYLQLSNNSECDIQEHEQHYSIEHNGKTYCVKK